VNDRAAVRVARMRGAAFPISRDESQKFVISRPINPGGGFPATGAVVVCCLVFANANKIRGGRKKPDEIRGIRVRACESARSLR